MQRRSSWTVESTIGLVFIIVGSVSVAMVLAVIGLTAYAVTTPAPEQTIIQQVETTGDVKRLCSKPRPANTSTPCRVSLSTPRPVA